MKLFDFFKIGSARDDFAEIWTLGIDFHRFTPFAGVFEYFESFRFFRNSVDPGPVKTAIFRLPTLSIVTSRTSVVVRCFAKIRTLGIDFRRFPPFLGVFEYFEDFRLFQNSVRPGWFCRNSDSGHRFSSFYIVCGRF